MSLIFGFFWFIAGCCGGLFIDKTIAFIFSVILLSVWEISNSMERNKAINTDKKEKKDKETYKW